MRHDKKKVVKICEELTMFFFSVGADTITSEIQRTEGQYIIKFSANYQPQYAEKLQDLDQYLNCDKEFGAAEEYWALAGASEMNEGSELLLIGMLIQSADISIEKDVVRLIIYKKAHN